ncbi:Belongs to the binding-protein-dependent transport system permease family. FecCD subfamily [Vibrio sp. B1FLJ16]|uniref:FecCD family ABC transporter permease n=1 Tax=Vibrio sp. B1FLJ16 TaxID=2751178 RepID=UPI0015F55225|nr:iron ABC transporter permease [Vibrio sp. B1FLJ16]CAD7822554.1 Belongs to the binding-protein-dependent transport system permease family. FecCD subfamily [Vibrio sp. B1FLJ16]CAE6949373.1 Belongs to the binding-protein-dependent transport system permease family. FecCD subfamily [Vibrio sp. B1FLJ16]
MLLRRIPLSSILLALSAFLGLVAVSSITVGPMNIGFSDSLRSLVGAGSDLAPHIQLVINEIRLPRTILCMFIGAILAICGVVMQGLFRNPLAEPGIIGVSAGAALGGAFAIVMFADFSQNYPQLMNLAALPLFAFLGGSLTTILVYKLGTNKFGTSVTIMLLAGVAISALSGAAIGYMNFVADDQMLRDLSLWSMGSLAGAKWSGIGLAAVTLVALLFWFQKKAMALNAFLLGESEARHLGIPVQRLKRQLIILSAVGVGVTVSICGAIGFIGLVIPHLGRMLAGPDHRTLLPISALLGALLLTAADMFARVAVAPAELPVGIVTALIGAPFFIYLLFQQKGKIL